MSMISEHFEEEIDRLNSLLTDSHLTTCALFQLLDSNGIHVGSPELIKAREKVEAEMQTLRTANAGLVEKIRGLEAARTQAAANSLANMLSYEELEAKVEAKVKRLEEAGDVMAKLIPLRLGMMRMNRGQIT
jgi:hypothetical protein